MKTANVKFPRGSYRVFYDLLKDELLCCSCVVSEKGNRLLDRELGGLFLHRWELWNRNFTYIEKYNIYNIKYNVILYYI